jgi:hypothetical protein
MSLALIEESAKEVRRLAIAGSPLAVGDFRLKKLIPPLEQAGAKVPVFAQVAKAISDLVSGTEAESPSRLLNLSTLINAILYTQGNHTTAGDFREFEEFPTKCSCTKTTSRVLKPLVQALTSSGAGRFEIIKSAVERGAMNDLRLIDPAIQALGDNYPELADLIAEKILPAYGPGIVPRLKANFDLKGKRHDARKLTVMHQLDPEGTKELCKNALDDGSPDVKAAAIACLGQHEDCLPLVMEQANSKNKQLRSAALQALSQYDRPEIAKVFSELLQGKTLDILVGPFRTLRNKQVVNSMVAEARRVLALVTKGESGQIPRFWEILDCLETRKDSEIEQFLLEALGHSEKLAKVKAAKNSINTGADITARVVMMLRILGTPKAFEAILARRDALPPEAFTDVLQTAARHWTPDKFFAEFSPLLAKKKGAAKEKNESLENLIAAAHWEDDPSHYIPFLELQEDGGQWLKRIQWDPRWLDAAIQAKQQFLVCALARPNHKDALNYLLKAGETKKTTEAALIVRGLGRCEYPKTTEYFLNFVSKKTKGAKQIDYDLHFLLRNARFLPVADLPKLDAFAATLDEKFVDAFLEAIAPLRATSQPT